MKDNFEFLGQGRIWHIQFPIIVAALLLVILLFLYRRMKFGRHIMALGSSEESVRVSGIRADRLRIKVYALSGVIAAVAGILLASRLTTVNMDMGKNYELEALGTLILFLIKNCLNLLNVNPFWETIVTGFIILVAVSVNFWGGLFRKNHSEYS
jgi:ribose transport system permease protein